MATYGGGMVIHSSGVISSGGSGYFNITVLSVPSGMYAEVRVFSEFKTNNGFVSVGGVGTGSKDSFFVPGGSSLNIQGPAFNSQVSFQASYVIFKNSGV